VRYMTTVTTNH